MYIYVNFANHALSEMILPRGELGRVSFVVGSRVQEYVRTSNKLKSWKKNIGPRAILTIFDSKRYLMIIVYIYALCAGRNLNNGENGFFYAFQISGGRGPDPCFTIIEYFCQLFKL